MNQTNKTLDWHRKCLNDFKAENNHLISLDWPYNSGAIDVKIAGTVVEEKLSFKVLGLSHSSKLDQGFYILSIVKTASIEIQAFVSSLKFNFF